MLAISASSFIYPFSKQAVRVLSVEGVPYFVAKDVADTLNYADHKKAIELHCKSSVTARDLGVSNEILPTGFIEARNISQTKLISERDMYALVFSSHKSEAELFKDWVFEDVLPSLRKHGEYTKADMQVAGQALQAASISGTDFATELASLREQLAIAQQEAQAQAQIAQEQAQIAHDAQRKLQNTVFQINGSITDNRCTVTDWRNRFEPLLCVYEKRANKWGVTFTPSDAVKALGDYAYEAQRLIRTALDLRPALVFALSQKGMDKELAYKVADELERYARETQAAAHTAAHAMQEGEL